MEPVSIRFNNPGALNTVAWVRDMPGYIGENVTTPGNSTAKFKTPEQGVAAYYTLLQRYRDGGHRTLMQIVNRYGGGQDYSQYVKFVVDRTGLDPSQDISLTDDSILLPFAKAMFWYEAGKRTPLTDAQIVKGFNLIRGKTDVDMDVDKGHVEPVSGLVRWLGSWFKN